MGSNCDGGLGHSTPTDRIFASFCACAPTHQTAVDPVMTFMKSRRRTDPSKVSVEDRPPLKLIRDGWRCPVGVSRDEFVMSAYPVTAEIVSQDSNRRDGPESEVRLAGVVSPLCPAQQKSRSTPRGPRRATFRPEQAQQILA
jgi:hypothetical protein